MDFSLSEQQRLMQNSMRDALRRESPISLVRELHDREEWFHPPLWKAMADAGWLGLGLPAAYGGEGGDAVDQGILCAELGTVLAPSAYLSAIVPCAHLVARAGTDAQKRRILPEVIAGRQLLGLALAEPDRPVGAGEVRVTAEKAGSSFRLSGTKLFVYGGEKANTFLWVARVEQRVGVFIVDARAAGVSVTPIPTLKPEGQAEVTLSNVAVPEDALLGDGSDLGAAVDDAVEHAALLKCLDVTAAARVAFNMAVHYAKTRVQYGRPIGSFQAISHKLVNAHIELDAAWVAAWQGVWTLTQKTSMREQRAIARAAAVHAAEQLALHTTTTHGGLGFMEKYDLQFFTKHLLSAAPYIGSGTLHREAVATAMGL